MPKKRKRLIELSLGLTRLDFNHYFHIDSTAQIKEVYQRIVVPQMTKKAEELGELTLYAMMDCYNLKEGKSRNYWSMAAKIMTDELSIEVGRYI